MSKHKNGFEQCFSRAYHVDRLSKWKRPVELLKFFSGRTMLRINRRMFLGTGAAAAAGLAASSASANPDKFTVPLLTPAPSGSLAWGWDNKLHLGSEGDFYVDAATGDDGNAGTSTEAAFATIQAGESAARAAGGGTVKVIGDRVKYREKVEITSSAAGAGQVMIEGYGTDKPILTGGEILPDLTPCVSADSAIVGSNWASIHKLENFAISNIGSVSKSPSTVGDPMRLNLFEDDEQMLMCVGWTGGDLGDKFWLGNAGDWYTADSVLLNGSNQIQSVTNSAVTDAFTAAQIENAHIFLFQSGTNNRLTKVDSVSGTTITPVDQTVPYDATNPNQDNFALVNLLPSLEQGQYGFKDNGDGTCNIYVWLNDSANASGGVEYCRRTYCVGAIDRGNWGMKGIDCRQVAGYGGETRDGAFIVSAYVNQATFPANVDIEHNRFYGRFSVDGGAFGALELQTTDNVKVHHNSIIRAQGAFGIYAAGVVGSPISSTHAQEGLDIQRNYFERVAQATTRIFVNTLPVVAHNKTNICGLEAHANKGNCYEQCDRPLWWGNVYVD